MTNEEFQRLVLAELGEIKEDIGILKEGQKDIKALIEDLDPKNANRHVEIISQINDLREDLNTIEVITSKNWNDIAKLKSVK